MASEKELVPSEKPDTCKGFTRTSAHSYNFIQIIAGPEMRNDPREDDESDRRIVRGYLIHHYDSYRKDCRRNIGALLD